MACARVVLGNTNANPLAPPRPQGIVKHLVDLEIYDEIWVLPVYKHMFSEKQQQAPFSHKMIMCQLAFEPLSTPLCSIKVKAVERTVCLRRLKMNPKSSTGTADVLDSLRASYPEITFAFALGADTYAGLASGKGGGPLTWPGTSITALKYLREWGGVLWRRC